MMKRFATIATAVALAVGVGVGSASQAEAATSGRSSCSTGKGVLRASDYWSPNGTKTLHQVYLTRTGKVKGNTLKKWDYSLYYVAVSDGSKVSYRNNAWIFQVPRNKKVNATVVWRAKHPLTLGKDYRYATCTMRVG